MRLLVRIISAIAVINVDSQSGFVVGDTANKAHGSDNPKLNQKLKVLSDEPDDHDLVNYTGKSKERKVFVLDVHTDLELPEVSHQLKTRPLNNTHTKRPFLEREEVAAWFERVLKLSADPDVSSKIAVGQHNMVGQIGTAKPKSTHQVAINGTKSQKPHFSQFKIKPLLIRNAPSIE
ncbi:unnamed protein product, partial [Meganyctiphanes norvegica]